MTNQLADIEDATSINPDYRDHIINQFTGYIKNDGSFKTISLPDMAKVLYGDNICQTIKGFINSNFITSYEARTRNKHLLMPLIQYQSFIEMFHETLEKLENVDLDKNESINLIDIYNHFHTTCSVLTGTIYVLMIPSEKTINNMFPDVYVDIRPSVIDPVINNIV